jgi:hypothetical protein
MFGFKKRYPITPTWVNISPLPEKTTSPKDLLWDFTALASVLFWFIFLIGCAMKTPHGFQDFNKIIILSMFFSVISALLVFVLLGWIDDIRCWLFKKKPSKWVFNYHKELLYTQESSDKVQQALLAWCETTGSSFSKSFTIKTPSSFEITCWTYKQDNRSKI